jgi:hypothetical protein
LTRCRKERMNWEVVSLYLEIHIATEIKE